MRINKFLAKSGFGSRRSVESLILGGKVLVNGKIEKNLATDIDELKDSVLVEDQTAKIKDFIYYLINKPAGYASTVKDPHEKKVVVDLVPGKPSVFPVGRLDRDSEGLMILTNDGEFANKITHPRYGHEKEYIVAAEGPSHEMNSALEKATKFFKCGCKLSDYKTEPSEIKVLGVSGRVANFDIVLKEGKKRQIRRVLDKAGFTVISLKRIRIGKWKLGDLEEAQYRIFNP